MYLGFPLGPGISRNSPNGGVEDVFTDFHYLTHFALPGLFQEKFAVFDDKFQSQIVRRILVDVRKTHRLIAKGKIIRLGCASKSNSTNGSWWIIQIQPKEEANKVVTESHHGSWWIVQIPPGPQHFRGSEAGSEVSTNCRWWD